MEEKANIRKFYLSTSAKLDELFSQYYPKNFREIEELLDSKEADFGDFSIMKSTNYALIRKKDEDFNIIFFNPIKVIFMNVCHQNEEIELIDNEIRSSLQIKYIIDQYKLENLSILTEDGEWENYEDKFMLLPTFSEKKEIIFKSEQFIRKYSLNKFCIMNKTVLSKKEITEYFDYYFEDSNNDKKLEYYNTSNREKLIALLCYFISSNTNIIKLTGPSNNGKSITLLYFSRCYNNIAYLNIKAYLKLFHKQDFDLMLNMYYYELQRIELNKEEIDAISKIFSKNNDFWIILYSIIEKIIDKNVTFILDQFSDSNINETYYNKIATLIDGKKIRIIICSSINDKSKKKEIITTLEEKKGNPKKLTKENEKYYHYISDLMDLKVLKEKNKSKPKICESFNYYDKYIKKLEGSTNESKLKSIRIYISNKINKIFKTEHTDYKDILINIQNYLNKDIPYEEANHTLHKIPLKFFKLILKTNSFQIDYQFPFIKIMVEECLSEEEVNNYFINKDYEKPDKKESKGIFFERAVRYEIKKVNLLPEEINTITKVNSIINFDGVEMQNKFYHQSPIIEIPLKEKGKGKKKGKGKEKKNRSKYLGKKRLSSNKNRNKKEQINKNEETLKESNIEINKIIEKSKELKLNEIKGENADDISNNGILIEQKNPNSPLLDLGYLYGKSDEKKLICFQIKNYGKNTDLKDEDKLKYQKDNIFNSLKIMTEKVKNSFKIIIKEYHFFFIIYFNENDDYKFNHNLVKYCNENDIKYIFYNPVLHKFYNEKEKEIFTLTLDCKTNLESDSRVNPYNIFFNTELFTKSNNDIVKYLNNLEDPKLYLEKMFNKNSEKNISFIDNFSRAIKNINNCIKSIEIIGLYEIQFDELVLYPKDSYGFLFDADKENTNYIFNFKNSISFHKITKSRIKVNDSSMAEVFKEFKKTTVLIIKAIYN